MKLILSIILAATSAFATVHTEVYYPFGEQGARGGLQAIDASGNRRGISILDGSTPASSTNVPTGIPSTVSLKFDGTGGYYAYNPYPYAPPNDNVGFEGWVRISDLSQTVVQLFGIGSDSEGFYALFDPSGGIKGSVSETAMGSPYMPASTNEWVHVAMVRNAGTTTFYVNGVGRSSASTSPGLVHNWTSHWGFSTAGNHLKGYMDEFRVFTFTAGQFSTSDLLVNATAPAFASMPCASQIQEGTNVSAGVGENITFTLTTFGIRPLRYFWYGGTSTNTLVGTNAGCTITNLTLKKAGDYYLVASNSYGRATSEVVHLTVKNYKTIQPDVGVTNFSPSVAQLGVMGRKWGAFVDWGMDTFTETHNGTTSPDPSFYQPVTVNADQWVSTCAAAGMKHVVVTAKHQTGFCMWPTAFTSYCVTNAACGDHQDVIRLVKNACDKYGLKLGIYYEVYEVHEPSYLTDFYPTYFTFMTNQIAELLSNYGPICVLWIDGAWERSRDPRDWHMPELYDLVKRLQPSCAVVMNGGIGRGTNNNNYIEGVSPTDYKTADTMLEFPFDVRASDPNTPVTDPKLYSQRNSSALYYLPYETPVSIITHSNYWMWWFWSPDAVLVSASSLTNTYTTGIASTNAVLLNVPPSTNGIIETAYSNRLIEATSLLGLPPTTRNAVVAVRKR